MMREYSNLMVVLVCQFKRFCIVPIGLALFCCCLSIGITQSVSASETVLSPISSNGFNLSHSRIERTKILSGGPEKDGIPALVNPPFLRANQVNYLVPSDRVIGVTIGDESRAYPLKILIWHEVINDTINGVPILVTYCPLCDSALVFHRKIEGEIKEFGVSGLLYQSNVLLYDRQQNTRDESLWSQLSMRAVTGPAAKSNLHLDLIDADLMTAHTWTSLHPETLVLSIATGYNRPYNQPAYSDYFSNDNLMFHVAGHTRRRRDLTNKDQVLLVSVGEKQKAYVFSDIERSSNHTIEDTLSGSTLRIKYDSNIKDVTVDVVYQSGSSSESSQNIKRAYMFWFAFDAFYPRVDVYKPDANSRKRRE